MSYSTDPIENAAITAAYRAERFGGENPEISVWNLLFTYINEDANLEASGLKSVYKRIAQKVRNENLIHLLLVGYYKEEDDYSYLCEYQTKQGRRIDLTVESVCKSLLYNNFQNVTEKETLIRQTPNFYNYYK